MRNYVSRAWFLHKQLGMATEAFNSFQVTSFYTGSGCDDADPFPMPSTHLAPAPHAALSTLIQLGIPGTIHEGVPHLLLPGDVQAEQSRPPLCFCL